MRLSRLYFKTKELPRMADWAEIDEVISRCLGHAEGAFLQAYNNNVAKQNQHALDASQVATAMIRFMEKSKVDGNNMSECFGGLRYFNGTMTQLRKELNHIAENELEVNIRDKEKWLQSPQALGNKITEAATNLRKIGIIIERPENKRNHSNDVILIKQNVEDGELESKQQNSFQHSSPFENDQKHAQNEQERESGGTRGLFRVCSSKKKEKI